MPRCAFHPDVETELHCAECDRPICPRDMIETPVGYKCPICAKLPRTARIRLRPTQLAGALGLGLLAGIGGALLLGAISIGFFSLILGFFWGGATSEAVHRGSGGHRGGVVNAIAIAAVVVGWFASIGIGMVLPQVSAVGLLTVIAAVVGAAGDTAGWSLRR